MRLFDKFMNWLLGPSIAVLEARAKLEEAFIQHKTSSELLLYRHCLKVKFIPEEMTYLQFKEKYLKEEQTQ